MSTYKKGQQIEVGNFIVSIGTYDTQDVAIISKYSGRIIPINNSTTSRSKKLNYIRRKFKMTTLGHTCFCFRFMTEDKITELLRILKYGANKDA